MCPRCQSNALMVRDASGWERIAIWFTGKRKYRCLLCYTSFRAPDRRKNPRAKIVPGVEIGKG